MSELEKLLAQIQGKIGSTLTNIGTQYDLPQLSPGGLGIQLQQAGAAGLTPEQRIAKMNADKGYIAPGDLPTALSSGLLTSTAAFPNTSGANSGGIYTPQAQTNSTNAVADYLKSQGVTDISTLNPVQQTQYNQLVSTPGGGAPGGPSEMDLANAAWNAAKQEAGNLRSRGQDTFNSLMASVKAFRDRSQTGFANAGQEITNTASDILGGIGRTAQELTGTSRALGRAMGLGDSSKMNAQNKILANQASSVGNALATKGVNNRANSLNLDANMATAQGNEDTAGGYLKQVNDAASQVESQGALGFGGALNNIRDYARNLAALTPLNAAKASSYSPNFAGATNTVNSGLLPNAGGPVATNNSTANPALDPMEIIRKLLAGQSSTGTYTG